MALKYRLVKRKDFSKGAEENDKLYYGQVSASDRVKFRELCDALSVATAASPADVNCVVKGLIQVIKDHLLRGNIVELGDLGNLRMTASSKGVSNYADFKPHLFKRARLVYTPGVLLRDITTKARFEEIPEKHVHLETCPLPHD